MDIILLHLKTNKEVVVNIDKITYFYADDEIMYNENAQATVINFINEKSIIVKESYEEVLSLIIEKNSIEV